MNYKTIINTPEMVKRDTLFIKYLNDEIKYSKEQYDYHNYQCNQGKKKEYNANKLKHYHMLLGLKTIRDEFFKITDNTNQEPNQ